MEIWRLATCGHGLHRSSITNYCSKPILLTDMEEHLYAETRDAEVQIA